ncbi:hypothetical protein DL240_10035 [Lujinxingia litoralis]|uniref:Amidohydrolase-related domain-containing protein n=1 Tax=Lujinxingia litoralis TaxID=2211119 RepID=A0A328C8D1_9DELT|nr:amidohydrolase family protein [Lujinxingia litoralis]RAL22185.1 hypothetical protein DL240_10035 [Lujinxingia litoralis]
MIIDAHVHLIGLRPENGCYLSPRLSGGWAYQWLTRALGMAGVGRDELDGAYANQLTAWVDESTLDAACLLAFDAVYDEAGAYDHERTQVYISNDYLFDVCARSEKLLPIASVNPQRRDAIDELERVVEQGAVAIKLLPNSQDIDLARPTYRGFWERMAKLDVPLLTHTSFEHTIPPINQAWGRPAKLILPLDCGVRVIAAHCAGSGVVHPFREDFDDWRVMLERFPNLYGDISAMASISRFPYLQRVLDDELARRRVILGSDHPVPANPWVFARRLGWQRARQIHQIANPLQRNLELFAAMGVDEAMLRRGAQVLRLPREFATRPKTAGSGAGR